MLGQGLNPQEVYGMTNILARKLEETGDSIHVMHGLAPNFFAIVTEKGRIFNLLHITDLQSIIQEREVKEWDDTIAGQAFETMRQLQAAHQGVQAKAEKIVPPRKSSIVRP
jgi:hypothetical protein